MSDQFGLLKHFCDAIWEYRPEVNQVYLHYDTMLPELCGQWLDYTELYQMHLDRYVYHEDVGCWNCYMSPARLLEFFRSGEKELRFSVRMENTRTGMQWHEAYIENTGENLLIGSRDMRAEQRNATITQGLFQSFDYVCRINVRSKSYVLYYSNNENTVVPQHSSEDYEQIMEEFNRAYVPAEECETLIANMRVAHVVEKLDHDNEYLLYPSMYEADGHRAYKKLRFCYADETKQVLLLTRTDVSEIMQEKQQRQKVEKRYHDLLTNMPIALCSTKVMLDEDGKPYDFCYTYCNPAHEKLEGVHPGELLGKGFYQFFQNSDPKWLHYYYETAWLGIPHVIREYSPEIGKDLLIHTFRTDPGSCDCVVQDITQENFLLRELHQSREEMRRILETTTTAVFQYDPTTDELQQNDFCADGKSTPRHADELFQLFEQTGRIDAESKARLQDCFSRIRRGEHSLSAPLRCTKRGSSEWLWFKLSLFDYLDENTKERKVLGYIQDINHDMVRQAQLRQLAQTDALTGLLNVGAGREKIQKLLTEGGTHCRAMFMMDVDNFKIVNDTYGHIMGDSTLKCFSSILTAVFPQDAVVYRLGGDEFSVFLPQLDDSEAKIHSLMHKFHKQIQVAQEKFPFLSVSVGIYITNHPQSYEQLYSAADKALYQTKKQEKGYYTVLNDSKHIF